MFTNYCSLEILSQGSHCVGSERPDAFRDLINSGREDSMLFVEECMQLSKMRTHNVPVTVP